MKKRSITVFFLSAAILLAAITCFGTIASADTVFTNPASVAFDFYPSKIKFEKDRVIVEGYFYNFTCDRVIHGIDNLEVAIYDADDETICYGSFTSLSDSMKNLRLPPGSTSLQVFEFNNTNKNPGDFNLQYFSAGILCAFTQSSVK